MLGLLVLLADIVHLKSGGKIEGIARREGDRVIIETLTGEMTVPADTVSSIDDTHVSVVEKYYERAKAIEKSVQAIEFLELAVWARDHKASRFLKPNLARFVELAKKLEAKGLQALAETARDKGFDVRPLWETLVSIQPDNETARRELGFRRHKGEWLTPDEWNAAIGNVLFEGKWIHEAQRDLIVKERSLKLEERAKDLEKREAKLAAEEKAEKDALAAIQKRLAELEERERRVRAREDELAQFHYCRSCRAYYRSFHVCETDWAYYKCCNGYFPVSGHNCKK